MVPILETVGDEYPPSADGLEIPMPLDAVRLDQRN